MIIAGVWYLTGELDKSETRVECLRREVEGKFGVVDEKFNRINQTVEEKFKTTNQTVEEKFKVADEKIAKSMETALKESSENFFKYNYSTEYDEARLHGKDNNASSASSSSGAPSP